jgi:hypothetical protein
MYFKVVLRVPKTCKTINYLNYFFISHHIVNKTNMSLNKFTDINDYKQWCNINCNAIDCKSLAVDGVPINPSSSKSFGTMEIIDDAQATQTLVFQTVTGIAQPMTTLLMSNFEKIVSHYGGDALRYTGTTPITVKIDVNVSWKSNHPTDDCHGSVGIYKWTSIGTGDGSINANRNTLLSVASAPNERTVQTSSQLIVNLTSQEYIQPTIRTSATGGGEVEIASVQFTVMEI